MRGCYVEIRVNDRWVSFSYTSVEFNYLSLSLMDAIQTMWVLTVMAPTLNTVGESRSTCPSSTSPQAH